MNTKLFTASQAERVIQSNLEYHYAFLGDYFIRTNSSTLTQVSDMEFVFRSEQGDLVDCMYISDGELPYLAYVTKAEAEFICDKYRCLIGKTELVVGRTIQKMFVANAQEMSDKCGFRKPCDRYQWGVYAEVAQIVKGLGNSTAGCALMVFNSAEEYNMGIPTVSNEDFAAASSANLWAIIQRVKPKFTPQVLSDDAFEEFCADGEERSKHEGVMGHPLVPGRMQWLPNGENRYMPLRDAFLLYHSMPTKEFTHGSMNLSASITYAQKGGWEPYYKFDCLTFAPVFGIYVDSSLEWGDSDGYPFLWTKRETLFDCLTNDLHPLSRDFSEALGFHEYTPEMLEGEYEDYAKWLSPNDALDRWETGLAEHLSNAPSFNGRLVRNLLPPIEF